MMALEQRYRIRKRPRRPSSDDYSIEEISADDMGYDADVEVLRPDQYEEPESDFEDDQALRRLWPDTDDELASRLRRLSCEREPKTAEREDLDRGRKRLSAEMDDNGDSAAHGNTEIEVSELIDAQAAQPPTKRRKRDGKTPLGQRVVRKQAYEAWSDSSDKSEDAAIVSSNSYSTPNATNTPSSPLRDGICRANSDEMEIG